MKKAWRKVQKSRRSQLSTRRTRYQNSVRRILLSDNLSTICTLHNFLPKILIFGGGYFVPRLSLRGHWVAGRPTLKSCLSLLTRWLLLLNNQSLSLVVSFASQKKIPLLKGRLQWVEEKDLQLIASSVLAMILF